MTKRIACVERIVAHAMTERGQTSAVFRSSAWTAHKDALGVHLMHYGTEVACWAFDGMFYATATSASDRDGVNTFCMVVKQTEAVRIRKRVDNEYGTSWWAPVPVFVEGVLNSNRYGLTWTSPSKEVVVCENPNTLQDYVMERYADRCDGRFRSIAGTRA